MSAATRSSVINRYGSKSCMNPNVSRVNRPVRFFPFNSFHLGLLQGGEFVTARARTKVQGTFQLFTHTSRMPNLPPEALRGTGFDTPGDLAAFSQKFDEGVKRVFSNDRVDQYVRFGSPRDDDPDRGIRAGRLTLTG